MIAPNIFKDSPSLHHAAADLFLNIYQASEKENAAFHVALSGGTTPKHLFQLLAKTPYAEQINWSNVHVYFGDERFVPHHHEDSNFKMATQTLLSHVNLSKQNIHPVMTSLKDAKMAADDYQTTLAKNLATNSHGNVVFDLVLLGLGPDGHTASLFPGTEILRQKEKMCDAVYVEKFDSWRISITLPTINHAKNILLLSEGEGKAKIINELVNSPKQEPPYPIQMIRPENKMFWYIDQNAAKSLL